MERRIPETEAPFLMDGDSKDSWERLDEGDIETKTPTRFMIRWKQGGWKRVERGVWGWLDSLGGAGVVVGVG